MSENWGMKFGKCHFHKAAYRLAERVKDQRLAIFEMISIFSNWQTGTRANWLNLVSRQHSKLSRNAVIGHKMGF